MTVLQGTLADRDTWSAVGECPIEKTMGLLGTKSAMLIMREAYYGTTRFEDFWRRRGIRSAQRTGGRRTAAAQALQGTRPAQPRRVRAHRRGARFHAGRVGDVR